MRSCTVASFAVVLAAAAVAASPLIGVNRVVPFGAVELPPSRASTAATATTGATAAVLLHESLFQKGAAAAIPLIEGLVSLVKLPAINTPNLQVGNISFSQFAIGAAAVNFAAPNQVIATMSGFDLAIPTTSFHINDTIIGMKLNCPGTFNVSMSNVAMRTTFAAVQSPTNQSLEFTQGNVSLTFGALTLHHDLTTASCQMDQALIEKLLGNLDTLIASLIEEHAGAVATSVLNDVFRAVAAKLVLPLAGAPALTSDSIALDFQLLPATSTTAAGSSVSSAFPDRDVELSISQASINNLLAAAQASGALNINKTLPANTSALKPILPAAYTACPDCPLQVATTARLAPSLVFAGQSASVTVDNLVVAVDAVGANGTVAILAISLNVSAALNNWAVKGAKNATLFFELAVPTFTMSLVSSAIGKIDIASLNSLVDFALADIVVPDFNKKFTGLQLKPLLDGLVNITDVALNLNGAVQVGADIDLAVL